jgi:prolipoprotein diacylglyceryltransferase
MGQWLCVPMLLFGAWLMSRARGAGTSGAMA